MNTSAIAQARSVSRPGLRDLGDVMESSERGWTKRFRRRDDIVDAQAVVPDFATTGTGRRVSGMLLDEPEDRALVARRGRLAQLRLEPGVGRSGRGADPAADAQHVGVVSTQQLEVAARRHERQRGPRLSRRTEEADAAGVATLGHAPRERIARDERPQLGEA